MFANLTFTTVDMDRWEEARAGIGGVKEMLRSREGFIAAIWYRPIDGQGIMVSHWDTEAHATDAAVPVGFSPAPGVTVTGVETREVVDQT